MTGACAAGSGASGAGAATVEGGSRRGAAHRRGPSPEGAFVAIDSQMAALATNWADAHIGIINRRPGRCRHPDGREMAQLPARGL